MNFKEICESVLEEASARGDLFPSVDLGRDDEGNLLIEDPTQRNIVKWVQDAYRRILDHSEWWSFLHNRGEFATIVQNTPTFEAPTDVDRCSLYFVRTDSTVRSPVYLMPYSWWVGQERSMAQTSGIPLHIINPPSGDWLVWPTPSVGGKLYGDWWVVGEDLVEEDDEPIWDARFHPLLKWEALKMFTMEYSDAEGAPQLMARVQEALPEMWQRFMKKYLPLVG